MPYPTRYPGAVWRPVPHHSPGLVLPPRGLLPHVQMGRGSLVGWFSDARSGVSSHLWVSRDGQVEQYVSLLDRAWAQSAGNPYWVSCECEGTADEDYTPRQISRLGEIYRWGMAVYGWPAQLTDDPIGHGLGTHSMGGAAWGGHTCPGPLRARRRRDILAAAGGRTPPKSVTQQEDDVPLTDAEITTIAQRAAAATLGALWAQMQDRPQGAADGWHPPHQDHAGATLRRGYEMTGEALTRIDSIEKFLGGPLAEWTAKQEATLAEIRQLVTGGALADADPTAAATLSARLDDLAQALAAPRVYTLTPGPTVAR